MPGAQPSNGDTVMNSTQRLCLHGAVYWRKELNDHTNKCKITAVIIAPKHKKL